MDVALPLDQMTTADKLRVLELVWDDLLRNPEQVPSPAWHGEVLAARAQAVADGAEELVDWEDAKRRLRERLR